MRWCWSDDGVEVVVDSSVVGGGCGGHVMDEMMDVIVMEVVLVVLLTD